METHRTTNTKKQEKISVSRPETNLRSGDLDWYPVCPQDRHSLGTPSKGNGLRQWNDLLAATERLAKSRRVGQNTRPATEQITACRHTRFFPSCCRFGIGSGGFWGAKTGPNPTDRRKLGSKHHLITDANGIPFAVKLTGANRHDITQLLPLVQAIPKIAGKRGRPRSKPDCVQGDRAYDSQPHRKILRFLKIVPVLARRRTANGSGLGKTRWVIERTLSWLHQFRRLRVRYERRSDIHEAFLSIACILICWSQLNSFC
jgi:transposase